MKARFSLKALLLCLTVLCLWFGSRVSSMVRVEAALAAIDDIDGWVSYGAPQQDQRGNSFSVPRHSRVVRLLWSDSQDDTVCTVYLNDGVDSERIVACDDVLLEAMLPHLENLGGIRELVLDGCSGITNDCVAKLTGLRTLESLNLCNTSIDDESVESLSEFRNLRELDIVNLEGGGGKTARRFAKVSHPSFWQNPSKSVLAATLNSRGEFTRLDF